MRKQWMRMISLISRGAGYQLEVGIALISIIPLLCFCFVAARVFWSDETYSIWTQILVGIFALVIGVGGYLILRKFPKNILKLRLYLRDIAAGELPEKINLFNSEDDINAIEKYLNMIVHELRSKVEILASQLATARRMQRTIEAQAEEIRDAERHRVMIESLGTACHYIGQPATVLRTYLDVLRNEMVSNEIRQKISECYEAAEAIADVLDKLRKVSQYRTVPYQTFHEEVASGNGDRILDIE